MQVIFEYVSTGDLWALAIIAAVSAILAANSNYQRRRALAGDGVVAPPAPKAAKAVGRVTAHA